MLVHVGHSARRHARGRREVWFSCGRSNSNGKKRLPPSPLRRSLLATSPATSLASLPSPSLSCLLLPPRILHVCHASTDGSSPARRSTPSRGRRRRTLRRRWRRPPESRTYVRTPRQPPRARRERYRFIGSHSRRHGNIYRQCERVNPGHIIKCIYRFKLCDQENWAQEGWGFWGSGGFSYLYEPLWWLGMITMILGEVANFAAYAFAPAVLVTPLGALSIIFSAVLAHFVLKEKLHMFGVVGCILCVVGSVGIVLHAPKEREIDSMDEIWHLATEPGFIVYSCVAVVSVLFLIFWVAERSGHRKMLVYIAICSTMGSLTVISVKAVAIALKLSFGGSNQFIYIQTWFFIVVVIICCLVQLNYLNKALDSFNTAVVSPVYYVMFTILTIFANMIMYKDSFSRNATQVATQLCGFVTIVAGTFLLHKTRDMGNEQPPPPDEICLDGESVRPNRPSQSS